MFKWLMASAILLVLGCSGPKVVPSFQAAQFNLTMLRDQRVAVWPLARGVLDGDTTQTMGREYPSRDQFMDAFSSKLSTGLITTQIFSPASISSGEVMKGLGADASTSAFLDPDQIMGSQDPANRFALPAFPPRIAALSQLPLFKGIRYAIVPRDLSMGRNVVTTPDSSGYVTSPSGDQIFVNDPGSSSATTAARLRLVVIDLNQACVVWDGTVFASASSNLMKASAFHEVEDELISNLQRKILGLDP